MWTAVVSLITTLFSLFLQRKSSSVTEGEGLGEQTQKTVDAQAALKTETNVANAEANAPSTVAGVEDRLKEGTF